MLELNKMFASYVKKNKHNLTSFKIHLKSNLPESDISYHHMANNCTLPLDTMKTIRLHNQKRHHYNRAKPENILAEKYIILIYTTLFDKILVLMLFIFTIIYIIIQFQLSGTAYLRKNISVISSVHQNQHKYNVGCNNSHRKH